MSIDAAVSMIKAGNPGRELPPTAPVKRKLLRSHRLRCRSSLIVTELSDRLDTLLQPLLEATHDSQRGHPEQLDLPSPLE